MYTSSILTYISWPALIVISYFAVRLALKLFEKKQAEPEEIAHTGSSPDKKNV